MEDNLLKILDEDNKLVFRITSNAEIIYGNKYTKKSALMEIKKYKQKYFTHGLEYSDYSLFHLVMFDYDN